MRLYKKKYQLLITLFLLLCACFFVFYFHIIMETGIIFTHLFYIPIITSAIWWKRKGIIVPVILSAFLLISHALMKSEHISFVNDLFRIMMFFTVCAIVIYLSEKISQTYVNIEKEENRYKTLFNNIDNAIIILETDDNNNFIIKDLNKKCKFLCEVQNNVVGQDIRRILSQFNDLNIFEILIKVFKTGKTENIPLKSYIHKNNIQKWLKIIIYKLPSKEIVICLSDETDRILKNQELIRLAQAMEQAGDGFMITNNDLEIIYINPAFEHLSQYSKEEIIGKKVTVFKSNKHNETFYQSLWKQVTSNKEWLGRISPKIKDENIIETEVVISSVEDKSENIINYVFVVRDVTEEIKLRRQIRHDQKIKSMGTLAGGIAHDFNNLLFPIIGYTEMTIEELPEKSEAKKNLEAVLKNANRAGRLINYILTFNRQNESGWQPISLLNILKDVLQFIRASLPSNIEIIYNAEDFQSIIMADSSQIYQAIMNICTNIAHKMTKKGGILEINLLKTQLNSSDLESIPDVIPGSYIKLIIKSKFYNQNILIEAPSHNIEFTDTNKLSWLSITHGIINSHDGYITMSGHSDIEIQFNIFLPLAEPYAQIAVQKV